MRRPSSLPWIPLITSTFRILFRTADLSQVKAYCQRQWSKLIAGNVSPQDFTYAKAVTNFHDATGYRKLIQLRRHRRSSLAPTGSPSHISYPSGSKLTSFAQHEGQAASGRRRRDSPHAQRPSRRAVLRRTCAVCPLPGGNQNASGRQGHQTRRFRRRLVSKTSSEQRPKLDPVLSSVRARGQRSASSLGAPTDLFS